MDQDFEDLLHLSDYIHMLRHSEYDVLEQVFLVFIIHLKIFVDVQKDFDDIAM